MIDPVLRGRVLARPALIRPVWANIGIMGDSGQGKTWLAGSMEDVEGVDRVADVDIEGGGLTLQSAKRNRTDIYPVSSWEDIQAAYEEFFYMCHSPDKWKESVETRLKAGHNVPFEYIVQAGLFDNVTELHKYAMAKVMDEVKQKHPDRDSVPSKREWGITSEMVRNFVREVRNLPMHTVLVFHQQLSEDSVTGEQQVRPSLPGKLSGEIPGYLDILGHLKVERTPVKDGANTVMQRYRRFLVQPDGRHVVKDRTDSLGDWLLNPTMSTILGPALESGMQTAPPILIEDTNAA